MSASLQPSERPRRLADRLLASQRKHFVGRNAERELFLTALHSQELPFAVLYLHGPGGIGKTTLLSEYAREALAAGVPVVRLDGRDIQPSPASFLQAFWRALGTEETDTPLAALAHHPRSVVLIDTYEALSALDPWLRDTFLPQLPEQTLVVIAGRKPADPAWRHDPGWLDLVRIVSLRNLRPEEGRAYLRARNVPEAEQDDALSFTHGHPLALALVAEVLARNETAGIFRLDDAPNVVGALLERFVEEAPSPLHRQALEICAHTRITTEALLASVLGDEEARCLFDWLRSLSFIEEHPDGIFPHDLARDVMEADLRWRNPKRYREIHGQVRDFIVSRLSATSGWEQTGAFFDLFYLHRNNPFIQPYYDWDSLGTAYAEPATAADFPFILSTIERYEGPESAEIARYWLERQPEAFEVFRGAGQSTIGFIASLAMHETGPEDCAVDPAIAAAWDFVNSHGGVRPGEAIIHHRYWSGDDTYQVVSPALNMIALVCARRWLTTPNLTWSFQTAFDGDQWEPMFGYYYVRRTPAADFTVGGHTYAVFSHDWRAEPPVPWLDMMADRELATDMTEEMLAASLAPTRLVLSQPDFTEAVRQALRDYHRPDLLATNPLLRSRLVEEHPGDGPPIETLRVLISEAAEVLAASPRDEKFYRAIRATYLAPAATQELAAERLNLPFSTYRYHLAGGLDRIAAALWQRELYGG